MQYRVLIAFIFYMAPLVAQSVIIFFRADDESEGEEDLDEERSMKTLGIINLIFILASDMVLLSLREQTIEIEGKESQAYFIYEPFF